MARHAPLLCASALCACSVVLIGIAVVVSTALVTGPHSHDCLCRCAGYSGKDPYGRGVSDMKGGIAASLLAARALACRADAWAGRS